jgi:hypothetical protein
MICRNCNVPLILDIDHVLSAVGFGRPIFGVGLSSPFQQSDRIDGLFDLLRPAALQNERTGRRVVGCKQRASRSRAKILSLPFAREPRAPWQAGTAHIVSRAKNGAIAFQALDFGAAYP